MLRIKFFPLVGQYTEAMDACITYHKERKLDYRVWSHMANIFLKSLERDTRTHANEMRQHLANLSLVRAIHIYTISRWNTQVDFVKQRFQAELDLLQARLDATEGVADTFVDWMAQGHPDQEETGLDEFNWQDIVWIYKDWALRQDLDLDDQVKAVKDL